MEFMEQQILENMKIVEKVENPSQAVVYIEQYQETCFLQLRKT